MYVVCDLVGGETTTRTFRLNATGARHVLAGFSGGIEAEDEGGLVPRPLLFGNFSLCGIMLSYRSDPLAVRRASGVNCLPRSLGDLVQEQVARALDNPTQLRSEAEFDLARLFARGNPHMSAAECAAYMAPFPDAGHRAATRAFPQRATRSH